ncbi:lipopolysaccharide biosynthesis protein [Phenylobacterium sp. LjRoot225]|uniref:lipopolysaccharide biosynthesis protein n=1 Tax=Phenylobacterium sp. LjRoot225 TaxID=3342285 RepID=UPI003ECFB2CE
MPEAASVVRRIYANLGRLLGGKAAAGLISLVYLAIAARSLGRVDYGVLVLVHTYAMTVAGIIEFPGWHAVVRYGAQTLADDDRPRLTRLIAFAGLVETGCGLLAIAAAALLAPVVGPRLGWPPAAMALAAPYSLAVLSTIRATPAGYLQLTGRFDLLGLHNLVAPTVRLAGAAVAAFTHAGLRGFLIAWLVAALAEWLAMWALGAFAARGRLFRADLAPGLRGVRRENPGLWRFMWGANIDVTLAELSGRVTPLAVGFVLGPGAAGLYAVAQRATSVLAQPAQVLGQAAYAELAHLVARGDRGQGLRDVLRRAVTAALVAAAPVCLVIALFGERLAVLIAGEGFAAAGVVMLWLALARAILLAGPPMSAALTALGRPGLSMRANFLSATALLLALPVLLQWRGLTGAGVQVVLQALVAVGLLALFLVEATAAPRPAAVSAEA